MILCDASPLGALVCPDEPPHRACVDAFERLSEPLLTTWVCFGEAMHIAGRGGRLDRQRLLWTYVERGFLLFHDPSQDEIFRMLDLMVKYQSRPMDLGDASLVAAAETLGLTSVFSLDSDFLIYRINDRAPFEVVP
jgi:uncharacterized protein